MSAPIIKYKTGGWGNSLINAVECSRETEKCVFTLDKRYGTERRHDKTTSYECYHASWADAHAYLLKKAEAEVSAARLRLEAANGKLGNIKGMKPSTKEAA
jgi:hypothetical protein